MSRKQKFECGTKNRIIEVGSKIFFEKGFDGTGIRTIMKEVGADVGAFYYYYDTKDELFDDVLDAFFATYNQNFETLAQRAQEQPYSALMQFFEYLKVITRDFREKYDGHMHRTIRWAIREHTLTVIEPYIERIVKLLVKDGAKPKIDVHLTAIFLAHGVGSVILHEDSDWVESKVDDMIKTVSELLGIKNIDLPSIRSEIEEKVSKLPK